MKMGGMGMVRGQKEVERGGIWMGRGWDGWWARGLGGCEYSEML